MTEWWRDPRCHFGRLDESSPLLADRADLQPAVDFICARLGLAPGARVLDLCCGPGRYVVELARRGLEVVGLDIDEGYVAQVERRFDFARSRIVTTFRRPGSEGPEETWSHSWRAYTLAELARHPRSDLRASRRTLAARSRFRPAQKRQRARPQRMAPEPERGSDQSSPRKPSAGRPP